MLATRVTDGGQGRKPVGAIPRGASAAIAIGVFCIVATHPVAARAAAPPPELLASIAIGPGSTLRGLAAYVDTVKPGAGARINEPVVRAGLASSIEASSLDGFDPASWTYMMIGAVNGKPAVALVSKVSDAKKLTASAGPAYVMSRAGWAIAGPRPLVDRIGAYALATLPAQRAPSAFTATVYMAPLVALYKAQIEAFRSQMLGMMALSGTSGMERFMTAYIDGMMSLLNDTDKVIVTLEASADLASLDVALVPRAGSRLAKFVAVQRPSDYALLDRLPDGPATMLFGGHFESGPYRAQLFDLMAAMYGSAIGKEMIAGMEQFVRSMTGDVAMAMRFAPGAATSFTQVFGLTDTAAADKAVGAIVDLFKGGRTFENMGITTTAKTNPTTQHRGVALRGYDMTYDLSKVPDAQRKVLEAMTARSPTHVEIGMFDRLGLITSGADGAGQTERAIDAARGKAPHFTAPLIVGQMLASSRARKDSMVMMMDIGSFIATVTSAMGNPAAPPSGVQPIVISLGCADRSAHLRIGVPAATARITVNGGKP